MIIDAEVCKASREKWIAANPEKWSYLQPKLNPIHIDELYWDVLDQIYREHKMADGFALIREQGYICTYKCFNCGQKYEGRTKQTPICSHCGHNNLDE